MRKNAMTNFEFTKLQRVFYRLNTDHLKLYEQDGNFPCGRQNQIVNPANSLIPQAIHGCYEGYAIMCFT